MRVITRGCLQVIAALGVAGLWLVHSPSRAPANTGQIAMFQDDIRLLSSPGPTLDQIRDLGATVVRVSVHWDLVAPFQRPLGFDGIDPASYPGWGIYDEIVKD